MRKTLKVIIVCCFIGFMAILGLAWTVIRTSGVAISVHGWIAIGLGTAFSLALSGVLFSLSFYSARSGHDDQIGDDR